MRIVALLALGALAGCGGGAEPAAQNDTRRLTDQIEKQRALIEQQTENGTAAIEQALENEQAIIFENRGNLLNEASNGATAETPPEKAAPAR